MSQADTGSDAGTGVESDAGAEVEMDQDRHPAVDEDFEPNPLIKSPGLNDEETHRGDQ
jgi:hypothetical protein